MTKEELLAEEHICNGKCQDDITKNYVHCKTCTRLKDFFAGYKAGKAELEAQIEKMKRCDMCKYSTRLGYCKIRQQGGVCENRNKWELDNLGENENDKRRT